MVKLQLSRSVYIVVMDKEINKRIKEINNHVYYLSESKIQGRARQNIPVVERNGWTNERSTTEFQTKVSLNCRKIKISSKSMKIRRKSEGIRIDQFARFPPFSRFAEEVRGLLVSCYLSAV